MWFTLVQRKNTTTQLVISRGWSVRVYHSKCFWDFFNLIQTTFGITVLKWSWGGILFRWQHVWKVQSTNSSCVQSFCLSTVKWVNFLAIDRHHGWRVELWPSAIFACNFVHVSLMITAILLAACDSHDSSIVENFTIKKSHVQVMDLMVGWQVVFVLRFHKPRLLLFIFVFFF